jgi:UDP-N-acetylmuramoyl-L-alanyl-D-glutamate--2,6-diaminopimelate ligase
VDTKTSGLKVFIDYAHTPDALTLVLETLRELMVLGDDESHTILEGKLLCLFGCGGNRDRTKRAPMGEVAGQLADVVIVTSDNPRFEDPDKIIEEILEGLKNTKADLVVEPDRRTAIRKALGMTSRGDVLLIAGKGHETWQRVRERRIPFEDRKVVGEELP